MNCVRTVRIVGKCRVMSSNVESAFDTLNYYRATTTTNMSSVEFQRSHCEMESSVSLFFSLVFTWAPFIAAFTHFGSSYRNFGGTSRNKPLF